MDLDHQVLEVLLFRNQSVAPLCACVCPLSGMIPSDSASSGGSDCGDSVTGADHRVTICHDIQSGAGSQGVKLVNRLSITGQRQAKLRILSFFVFVQGECTILKHFDLI